MLENWLSDSQTCVKWNNLWSYVFHINFGVRQGLKVLHEAPENFCRALHFYGFTSTISRFGKRFRVVSTSV